MSSQGYTLNDKNLTKITNFPTPKTQKSVKQFLATCSYFRTLIPNFASTAYPLINLTKKNKKFTWSTEEQEAFSKLKIAITSAPILKGADFNKKFYIICDGSKIGIGSILLQEHSGTLHPIVYYSRKLKDAETRYPSIKIELLALHDSVKTFSTFLVGNEFTILTDCKALVYNLNLNNQPDIVARWILYLQNFKFNIFSFNS